MRCITTLALLALVVACQPKKVSTQEPADIFDGQSLSGWESDSIHWRVEDGNIVGETTDATPLQTNNFLIWTGVAPGDFELTAEFNITESGNSGIQYRSERVAGIPHALRGYQADIDGQVNYTGQNYEERGRTTLAYRGEQAVVFTQDHPDSAGSFEAGMRNNAWINRRIDGSLGSSDSLRQLIKKGEWNTCRIVARGNRLQHYINDVLMSDVTDEDSVNRKSAGMIGLQLHAGPPMRVMYRRVRLVKW